MSLEEDENIFIEKYLIFMKLFEDAKRSSSALAIFKSR